jgi:hypothetical protein
MVEFVPAHAHRINWQDAYTPFEHTDFTSMLYGTFSSLLRRIDQSSLGLEVPISSQALQTLAFFLAEETFDLCTILGIDEPVYFNLSKEMPAHEGGVCGRLEDGKLIILLSEQVLIKAALVVEKYFFIGAPSFQEEDVEGLREALAILAHELGHAHQHNARSERFLTHPPVSIEADSLEEVSDVELARYSHSSWETNAQAIAIRYVRVKQMVEGSIWRLMGAKKWMKDTLTIILVSGFILDVEKLQEIHYQIEEMQRTKRANKDVIMELSRQFEIIRKRTGCFEERLAFLQTKASML